MKISIVVPVYNVENELSRCIDSLINQTFKNIEIILVDDGSTDSSPLICDEYSKKDNRIIVVHKSNGGLSDARNVGIEKSSGEYFLLIDSDDYIDVDSCERFEEIICATNADIIVSNAIQEREDGIEYMEHTNLKEKMIYSSYEYITLAIKAREWFAPACFNCYKKQLFEHNGLKYRIGMLHEDMEMLPRVFMSAKSISYLDKNFYHYIVRKNSIMSNSKKEINGKHLMIIYKEWFSQFSKIENYSLRKLLFGYLIKHFLHTCRELEIVVNPKEIGVPRRFLIIFGLDLKEKIKGLIYYCLPKFYIRL